MLIMIKTGQVRFCCVPEPGHYTGMVEKHVSPLLKAVGIRATYIWFVLFLTVYGVAFLCSVAQPQLMHIMELER